MKTKSFYARVEFTDAQGKHAAGSVVNLPYGSDQEIADAHSMVAYGVVSEQAPEPEPEPVQQPSQTAPLVGPGPMVMATREEQDAYDVSTHDHSVPESDEPQPGGDQAEANALAQEADEPASDAPHPDNPDTSFHDARDADGKFTSDTPGEREPQKAPAKKATRRRK